MIELLLVLTITLSMAGGIFVYYNKTQKDSQIREVAQVLISLGSQLNEHNISYYGTDINKMKKNNIIDPKYVTKNNRLFADTYHEIKLNVKKVNPSLSNSEFKNNISKLGVLEISMKVKPEECGRMLSLTKSYFKFLKTDRSNIPLINEYRGLSSDYSLEPNPVLKCIDGKDTLFTYNILFKEA